MALQPRRDWSALALGLGVWSLRKHFIEDETSDDNQPFKPVHDHVRADEGLPWGWNSDERSPFDDSDYEDKPVHKNEEEETGPRPWRRVGVTAENPLGEEAAPITDYAEANSLSRRTRLYGNGWSKPCHISSTAAIEEGVGYKQLTVIMRAAQLKMLDLSLKYWPRLATKWFRKQARNVGFSTSEMGGEGRQGWRVSPEFQDNWGFKGDYGATWEDFGRVLENMTEIQSVWNRYAMGANPTTASASRLDKVFEKAQEFFVVLRVDKMVADIREWRDALKDMSEMVWDQIDELYDCTADRAAWDRNLKHGLTLVGRQTLREFDTWVEEFEARKHLAPIWEFEEPTPERLEILEAFRAWKKRKENARVVDWNALGNALPDETVEEILLWATPVEGERDYDSSEDREDEPATAPNDRKRKERSDDDEDPTPVKKPKQNPAPKNRKGRDDDDDTSPPTKKQKGRPGGSSSTAIVLDDAGSEEDEEYEPAPKKIKGREFGRPKKNTTAAKGSGGSGKPGGYRTRSRGGA